MLKSFLKFARVRIIITSYSLAFLGSIAVDDITPKTFLTLLIIVTSIVHGNSINDFADQDIDSVNLKNASDRPLITKDISHEQLLLIHIASGLVALALSWLYGPLAIILTLFVLGFNYAYSVKPLRLTDRTLVGPLALALAYTFYPFSLGVWSTNYQGDYPLILAVGLYIGFIARILLKDFRDVKGDREYGKITFLLRFGPKTTCVTSGVLLLFSLLIVGFATSFAIGMMVVLFLGFLEVVIMLNSLAHTKEIKAQEGIIIYIAKAANLIILALLVHFLCQREQTLSNLEYQLIPAIVGGVLLIFNFLRYKAWTESNL